MLKRLNSKPIKSNSRNRIIKACNNMDLKIKIEEKNRILEKLYKSQDSDPEIIKQIKCELDKLLYAYYKSLCT